MQIIFLGWWKVRVVKIKENENFKYFIVRDKLVKIGNCNWFEIIKKVIIWLFIRLPYVLV